MRAERRARAAAACRRLGELRRSTSCCCCCCQRIALHLATAAAADDEWSRSERASSLPVASEPRRQEAVEVGVAVQRVRGRQVVDVAVVASLVVVVADRVVDARSFGACVLAHAQHATRDDATRAAIDKQQLRDCLELGRVGHRRLADAIVDAEARLGRVRPSAPQRAPHAAVAAAASADAARARRYERAMEDIRRAVVVMMIVMTAADVIEGHHRVAAAHERVAGSGLRWRRRRRRLGGGEKEVIAGGGRDLGAE